MLSQMPEGWAECSIERVADVTAGQSPPGETYNDKGLGLPFFQGKADFGDLHPVVRKWCVAPKKTAQTGDILISVRAPVGSINIAKERCCIGRGLAAISPDETVALRAFVYWTIKHREPELVSKGQGSTFAAIGKNDLMSLPIPLPPLPEQKRIAEILGSVDASIEATRAVIGQAERVKRGLMEELLTGGLGSEAIGRGEAPDGWVQKKPLEEYVENSPAKWDGDTSLPYIGLEHIEQATGQLTGCGASTEVTSAKNKFESGDVLFGKLRPNLRKFWKAKFEGICSTDILVLRPKTKLISPEYLFVLVQSEPFLSFAANDAAGTKMPRTSWKRLATLEFPVPPLPEQKRIAEILSSIDDFMASQKAIIKQQTRAKKGLMDDLLTGRVRTI